MNSARLWESVGTERDTAPGTVWRFGAVIVLGHHSSTLPPSMVPPARATHALRVFRDGFNVEVRFPVSGHPVVVVKWDMSLTLLGNAAEPLGLDPTA